MRWPHFQTTRAPSRGTSDKRHNRSTAGRASTRRRPLRTRRRTRATSGQGCRDAGADTGWFHRLGDSCRLPPGAWGLQSIMYERTVAQATPPCGRASGRDALRKRGPNTGRMSPPALVPSPGSVRTGRQASDLVSWRRNAAAGVTRRISANLCESKTVAAGE